MKAPAGTKHYAQPSIQDTHMMRVALIGATGRVGSRILAEALARGHRVTALARRPDHLQSHPQLWARRANVKHCRRLARLLADHDTVISSVPFLSMDARILIDAVKRARVQRFLVVGGAGSLEVAPGVQLVDSPSFPVEYRPEALAGRDLLDLLRNERELAWTFLSPSAVFAPGARTGKFRVGADELLVTVDGESRISFEDYAIAMLDEMERPRHIRERFTVGY
jgi:uncharacterized protein